MLPINAKILFKRIGYQVALFENVLLVGDGVSEFLIDIRDNSVSLTDIKLLIERKKRVGFGELVL